MAKTSESEQGSIFQGLTSDGVLISLMKNFPHREIDLRVADFIRKLHTG